MTPAPLTPEPILQIVTGLWAAGVLKSGLDLQVFDQLSTGPQDIAPLSQALGASPQSLPILLDALVALGLLDKQPQGYALTGVAAEFLVSSKPTYLGGLLTETTLSPTV